MDVKESFQKITEWAKTHPWLAGGILLIVVLIAWWMSKQNVGSSSIDAVAAEEPSEPSLGSLGSGGSLLDTVANQTDGITQPAPVYDAPLFDSLPSIPDMTNAGMFDPGSVQDVVYAAPSTTSSVSEAMSSLLPGASAMSVTSTLVEKKIVRPKDNKTARSAAKSKITRPPLLQTLVGSMGKSGTSAKTSIKRNDAAPVIVPATTGALAPNFTGWLGGLYYYNGLPANWMGGASANVNLGGTPSKSGGGRTGR